MTLDMFTETPQQRIKSLTATLRDAAKRYYDGEPVMSDTEYDELFQELQILEIAHPDQAMPDSPTKRVGAPATGKEHKHLVRMMSLENAFDEEKLRAFDERIRTTCGLKKVEYVVEAKKDGLSLSLTYKGGKLVTAATRGDGYTGELIPLGRVKYIQGIPDDIRSIGPDNALSGRDVVEVRGEVLMTAKDFERANGLRTTKRGKAAFANARNAAVGTLRREDSTPEELRCLTFFAYAVGECDEKVSQMDLLQDLIYAGFNVGGEATVLRGIDNVIKWIGMWRDDELDGPIGKELSRRTIGYDTDGVVVKANDRRIWNLMGATGHHPNHSIAFKFPEEEVQSVLLDIEVTVGKDGRLQPTAVLEPVQCSGVTIQRATLHNQDFITDRDIRIGDTVVVKRAGEVIPRVERIVPDVQHATRPPYKLPSECPACGGKSVREEGSAYVKCVNPSCPAQLKKNLEHYCSRDGMDIEGVSTFLIDQLVDKGLVRNAADLYRLGEGQLAALDRMGKRAAEKAVAAIQASRHGRSYHQLIDAIGVPRSISARDMAAATGDIYKAMALTAEQWSEIPGIGGKVAEQAVAFFGQIGTVTLIARLEGYLDRETFEYQAPKVISGSPFAGKSVLFTGSMTMGTRGEMEDLARSLGATVVGGVSAKTDYLIAGEKAGSKLEKANKLGVHVLSEQEFRTMAGV